MHTSDRIAKLGSGVFYRNDLRKQKYVQSSLEQEGLSLFDLSLGSTDLFPPKDLLSVISNGLKKSVSSSYCLHAGTKPFREAAASWAESRFGVSVDPEDEVLFLVGSQEGTAHLPLAVLNPGDSALILNPSYPSHRGGLVLADALINELELKVENNWRPDFQSLSTTELEQLKLIIMGFPHNPTAQVGKQSWLDDAMNYGLRNQIVIAHDNPYVDLVIEGDAPCLLRSQGWRESGIEFFSLSKGWCLGGYRLAFAIGARPLIAALRKLKSYVDFNQSLALQNAAIEALLNFPEWPQQICTTYKERRDRSVFALRNSGWNVSSPSMAMYLWIPIPSWAKNKGWNDEQLTSNLLTKTGIAVTPGSGFGSQGADWIRLALVRPANELENAISRMRVWWDENC